MSIRIALAQELVELEERRRFYDARVIDNAFHKDRPVTEAKYIAASKCERLIDQLIEAHIGLINIYRENQ